MVLILVLTTIRVVGLISIGGTEMEPLSFDIMDRLRVVFESDQFVIRPEHQTGRVIFPNYTYRSFKIVNGLCTPQEVQQLFNCVGIAQVIIARVPNAESLEYLNTDSYGFIL